MSNMRTTRTSTGSTGGRPMIMGTSGVVSAGHYLAAEAGMTMFRRGGNAFDAAAAAGFALTVLLPEQNGLAGEVPMLLHSARDNATWSVNGNGAAPAVASLAKFRDELGLSIIPGDGLLPAVVPANVASWILVLRRFGTMRIQEVLAPAIELAENGFAMSDHLNAAIAAHAERFRKDWPTSAEVFLPHGRPPAIGELWRQTDLARTLKRLYKAADRHRRRIDGLRAAHDVFYRGPISRRLAGFCRTTAVRDSTGRSHTGLLTEEDFAGYEARLERAESTAFRRLRVYKCGTWSQGPVMLQALGLLEGFGLANMGHNSADYIHTVVECMKLAYADREFFYGDPDFSRVPIRRLLSKAYAAGRRKLIDAARASLELRPGGGADALTAASIGDVERAFTAMPPGRRFEAGDTTTVQAADREGNVISAVTSGGWLSSSPVVPGLGMPLGTRGQMFSLVPGHPNCIAGGKRPRTTLTPTLAGLAGRPPHLAFASPGGDCQDQWALQFFLNAFEFGMSLQEAVEAPTFWTTHFPGSFYPRTAEPASLHVESRIDQAVRDELASRGHRVHVEGPWSGGNTLAAGIDRRKGVLLAAASPRHNPAYAMGW